MKKIEKNWENWFLFFWKLKKSDIFIVNQTHTIILYLLIFKVFVVKWFVCRIQNNAAHLFFFRSCIDEMTANLSIYIITVFKNCYLDLKGIWTVLVNLSMISKLMGEDVVEMSYSIRSHSLRHLVKHLPKQFDNFVSFCKMSAGRQARKFAAAKKWNKKLRP